MEDNILPSNFPDGPHLQDDHLTPTEAGWAVLRRLVSDHAVKHSNLSSEVTIEGVKRMADRGFLDPANTLDRGLPVFNHTAPVPDPPMAVNLSSVADLLTIKPPSWTVPEFVPSGGVTLLSGESRSFKTCVAIHWALCAVRGRHPLTGDKTDPQRVLYLVGEDEAGFAARAAAAGVHDLSAKQSKRLALHFGGGNLLGTDLSTLTDAVATHRADLVVLDTLQRYRTDSFAEDSAGAIGPAWTALAQVAEAVLVVHHSGWDTSRLRGSSAMLGDSVAVWHTTRFKGRNATKLECSKMKNAAEPTWVVDLDLRDVGSGSESVAVVGYSEPTRTDTVDNQAEREAWAAIATDLVDYAGRVVNAREVLAPIAEASYSLFGVKRVAGFKQVGALLREPLGLESRGGGMWFVPADVAERRAPV